MDTERLRPATQPADGTAPIDWETISETIHGALRTGSGPIDPDEMAGLAETLRGHIALLLIEARQRASQLGRGTIEAQQAATRLGSIERQFRRPLASLPLSAHVQVQRLARDCQWLLARHSVEARS
ncbi:DUF6415 family natural product biosynthesis protein [Streptomyces lydicus]|uniref:DUF6415 family natural product biosynthesis protein n=1 Tax=Streptomyces lydicus TaxID=47763 RepID=UPI001011E20E|nr:DUF6415 family natural product biosynthesis protein [Streptomyces lydicus]MDC7337838.1 DUF6415 family natural product biosynthesis protein [Streptomyces lydicus]UEG92759.1 DUF6415 family natural product biosynthesis protein [Streptomyces lydicus]